MMTLQFTCMVLLLYDLAYLVCSHLWKVSDHRCWERRMLGSMRVQI